MNGYYHKIFLYIIGAAALAAALFAIGSGMLVPTAEQDVSIERKDIVDTVSQDDLDASATSALVLYDPGDEESEKYRRNLERTLRWLRIDARFLDAARTDTVSYNDFDMVVVALSDWDGSIGNSVERLGRYVDEGGKLLLGLVPSNGDNTYQALHRRMGVIEYGGYCETEGLRFTGELIPGATSQTFEGDAFSDVVLGVRVEDNCTVLATALDQDSQIPLVWLNTSGKGTVLTYNGTAIVGDSWTGFAAGCVCALLGNHLYPVINTKTVFIDDFPSPQYNTQSDVIEKEYNRTVQEFYRDIWWPDMQNASRRYNVGYVGLFIPTYNDIVDPDDFSYQKDTVEQYFGNSLLENGFEIGAHGYNHQSLAVAGHVPKDLGYNPWADEQDMEASLTELLKIGSELFSDTKFYTYVPPSNYLDEEGRAAVVASLPDLRTISGVYTDEGSEGSVYVQDYEIASDGIAEFPRATSGTLDDPYDRFTALSVGGLYGVYSHFIHPDDILDEERGQGHTWEELYDQYTTRLQYINDCLSSLEPATALEASEALRTADRLDVAVSIGDGRVQGSCNGFTGKAYCFFRTDSRPVTDNDSCRVTPVSDVAGESWYLVEVLSPTFSFALEG